MNARFTAFAAERSQLPWREYPRALRAFAKTLLAERPGRFALALRRLTAQEILVNARCRPVGRRDFLAALRGVEALGYSGVEHRVLIACVVAQWSTEADALRREARAALDAARDRVSRLPKRAVLRRELLSTLALNARLLEDPQARRPQRRPDV